MSDLGRLRSLFEQALAMPVQERESFLRGATADDQALYRMIRRMLEHVNEEESGTFADDDPTSAVETLPVGTQIGAYTITSLIGIGGMGNVYAADQQRPKRSVALKLIRPGLASPRLLKRFDLEAEILGRLKHPGIGAIHEAGLATTPHGEQPFFAMELVEGLPLNTYADNHGLKTRARIELMARVCDAVQHAHQHGVIHRDLKPTNILVTPEGQPKVLDFGIARVTDSDIQATTIQTDIGQLIGTIPYMSPEQAGGSPNDLDTRSDVYALGVILYQLLAERLPYDLSKKLVHEAVRIIQEDVPMRLSSIHKTLRGDIETIVGKALEKEKERRYQSANALSADIQRYLGNEPIAARPPSVSYQLRKFATRNKALVTGATSVFVALLAGVVGTGVALDRAVDAEVLAQERLAQSVRQERIAGALNSFLMSAIEAPTVDELGPNVLLRQVLVSGEANFSKADELEPIVGIELRLSYGRAYRALGIHDDSERMLREALERAQALRPHDARLEQETRRILSELLLEMGRHADAVNIAGDKAWKQLAGVFHDLGDYELAELAHRKSYREALREDIPDEHQIAIIEDALARLLIDAGLPAVAKPLINKSLSRKKRLVGEKHRLYFFGRLTEAYLVSQSGNWDRVHQLYREAADYYSELFEGTDSPMLALLELEEAGVIQDRLKDASALDGIDKQLLDRLGNLRPVAAIQMRNRGRTLYRQGRQRDGQLRFELSIEISRSLAKEVSITSESHTRRAWARVLRESGQHSSALHQVNLALELVAPVLTANKEVHVAPLLIEKGRILTSLGHYTQAHAVFEDAQRLRQTGLAAGKWPEYSVSLEVADAFEQAGDDLKAREVLKKSLEQLRDAWSSNDPRRTRLDELARKLAL